MKRTIALVIGITTGAWLLSADEVRTTDGSVFQGTVTVLSADTLDIQTATVGKLSLPRAGVSGLTIAQPVSVRLDDASVLNGPIDSSSNGNIKVGAKEINLIRIKELWPQNAEDPQETARKAELAAKQRKWKTDLTIQASKKSGNTRKQDTTVDLTSLLSGPKDALKMYGRFSQSFTEKDETTDERIAGAQYSWYFVGPLGLYIRTEIEKDEYENIDLRSTTASGLSYRWTDTPAYKLSTVAGLSYRYEQYADATPNDGFFGLDFGLSHFYRFKNRWEIKNDLTYIPAVEDFNEYLITQDSYLALPVSPEWWKVKFGVRNDYNNRPLGEGDHVDSTWYAAISATKE